MRNIHRFVNKKPVIVTEKGIQYKIVDLGGHKMKIRIRSDKEMTKDSKLFKESQK
jgi:hypothetical protein